MKMKFPLKAYPWNLRLPTPEQYHYFSNLVQLHELTLSWLNTLQLPQSDYSLSRGFSKQVSENLWMLDSLSQIELEDLMDDTSPSDTLGRLEYTIWAVQSATLATLFSRTVIPNQRDSLESALEQISWKKGKECCESRWKFLTQQAPQDLNRILFALHDSPFSGFPSIHSITNGFLVRRAVSYEIQLELRSCPHQIAYQEALPVADSLCRLHSQWMRGFVYALNHKANLQHTIKSPRCIHRWHFLEGQKI